MLRLPTKRLGVSAKTHNNDLMVLCDWVECSALVTGESISKAALTDLLVEEHIYTNDDLCASRLEDVWAEIDRRHNLLGPSRFIDVGVNLLQASMAWQNSPAATFCLVCSLSPNYTEWTKQFGRAHSPQGELFERICEVSLRLQLPACQVRRTGWSSTKTSGLAKVVKELAEFLGDDAGNLKKWAPKKGKEAGVDLAWFLPMVDDLPGPRYFGQCASGADWRRKRHEPDLATWAKYIDFVNTPQRVMLMPFAVSRDEFVRMSPAINGVLVERYRLLSTGQPEVRWVPGQLERDLVDWLTPRVDWLKSSQLSLTPV